MMNKNRRHKNWQQIKAGDSSTLIGDLSNPKCQILLFGPKFDSYFHQGEPDPQGYCDRHEMSVDLIDFLNGGLRPAWLDDMELQADGSLLGADGSRVCSSSTLDVLSHGQRVNNLERLANEGPAKLLEV
jgi:hypothetical protein